MIFMDNIRRLESDRASSLIIQQSFWGLCPVNDDSRQMLEHIELASKVLALILPTLAGLIFISGQWIGLEDLSARAIISSSMVLLSLFVYSRVATGLIDEMQIDRKRRVVYLGMRDSQGTFRVKGAYPVEDVVSVFIRRSKNRDALATLNMMTRESEYPVRLLKGTESSLLPVLDYLVALHETPKSCSGRTRVTTTGKWIHARFG